MDRMRSLCRNVTGPLALLVVVCLLGGAAACQTTKGFGRDIENLGDNIEDAAEDAD